MAGELSILYAGWEDTYVDNDDFIMKIMYRSLLYRYSEMTENGIWLHHADDVAERLYQVLASKRFHFIKIKLTSHGYCIVFICASQLLQIALRLRLSPGVGVALPRIQLIRRILASISIGD
jgi:hypothetical protein